MNERRALVVAGAIALGITLLFYVLLVRPKIGQIAETKQQIETARSEETRLRAEITRLEAIRRDEPATVARLARISEYLPSEPGLPAFIRAIQGAATLSGVDLLSIAPGQPALVTGATGIEQITVSIAVDGAYVRIQDFLARLESLQRIVQVTSLSLAPKDDELSSRTLLATTMSLTMYVVQPNATLRTGSASPSPSPSPTS